MTQGGLSLFRQRPFDKVMKKETESIDTTSPATQPGKAGGLQFLLAVPQKHPDESGSEFALRAMKHLAAAYREKERKQQIESESETQEK